MKMQTKFVISMLFAILVATFALQNANPVNIKVLFTEFSVSQALVILGSAVLGAIIVLLLGLIKQMKLNKQIKNLTKEVTALQEENDSLKQNIEVLQTNSEEYVKMNTDNIENKNEALSNEDVESEINTKDNNLESNKNN